MSGVLCLALPHCSASSPFATSRTHTWVTPHSVSFTPKLQSHISSCLLVITIWMPRSRKSQPNPKLPSYSPIQWLEDSKNLQLSSILPLLSQLLYGAPVTKSHKVYLPKSYSTLSLLFCISTVNASSQALPLTHLDCCTSLLTGLISSVYSLPVQFPHSCQAFY